MSSMLLAEENERLRSELERFKWMSGRSLAEGLSLSLPGGDSSAISAPLRVPSGQFRLGAGLGQIPFSQGLGPVSPAAAQMAFEMIYNRQASSAPVKPQPVRPNVVTTTSSLGSDRDVTDGGASSGQPSPRDLDLNLQVDQDDSEVPEASTADFVTVKRERDGRGTSEDEDGGQPKKKLRLSREQSQLLEQAFTEHSTLNPKQKNALARQLGLRPRQVEVWFQNRRARTKLKQTEVDCEVLKKCCETLTEENRRLQKELQELKAMRVVPPCIVSQDFCVPLPAATLAMCPSCERVTVMDNRGGSVVLNKPAGGGSSQQAPPPPATSGAGCFSSQSGLSAGGGCFSKALSGTCC